jgi:glutathione S-transferase
VGRGYVTSKTVISRMPSVLLWPLMKLRLRRNIGGMAEAQGFGRMPYAELIRQTGNRLDDLVTLLGDRAFFFSDRFSAADLALYGELRTGASGSTPDFEAGIEKPCRPYKTETKRGL